MGKHDIVETKTYDFDQMLKDQAAQATHPEAITSLIALARQAGSRGTARALQRVQRRLERQIARDARRLIKERAKLEQQTTRQPVYQPPVVGQPVVHTRHFDPDSDIQMDLLSDADRGFAPGHGQRDWQRRSTCTSGWGNPTHPRERSIVH